MNLDFSKDIVTLKNGQKRKFMCTFSGHYCLPMLRYFIDINLDVVLHVEVLANLSHDQKGKKTLKFHKQFSHAPMPTLT